MDNNWLNAKFIPVYSDPDLSESDPAKHTEKKEFSLNMPDELMEQMVCWRKDLHQIPETGLHNQQTAAYLQNAIRDLPYQIRQVPEAGSGFFAFMDLGKEKTIAFRTDTDALPVTEETEHDFPSKHPGNMHACGHDGHMTLWLGLAHALASLKDQLDCNILLIAQSGEESPGGAEPIIRSGLFEDCNVSEVYGLHLMPGIDKGVIATRPLEMMARCAEVHISITGTSVHAAKYRQGNDAMEAGAWLLLHMYELEKSLPEDVFRLLRFGSFHAGSACNVVCDACKLEGTLRAFQDETFDFLKEGIERLAKEAEEKYGVSVHVDVAQGYPAVMNDESLTKKVMEDHPEIALLDEPEMISEDFSFYQKKAPGIFFFLGTGTTIPLHSCHFDFDPAVLMAGLNLFASLALKDKASNV